MATVHPFRKQTISARPPARERERTAHLLTLDGILLQPEQPHAPALDPLVPTLFHERWWLDVATKGRLQAAEFRDRGRLVGWLPYVISRRRVFQVSVMPDLTHLLGAAIDEGSGSSNTRWLRRLDILRELTGQVPALSLFSQTCHPDTPDVLGFQACGFDTSVQFTAEIPAQPEDLLWRAMRDKTRNVIRRAAEREQIEVLHDPHEFRTFYEDNLRRGGHASYFDLDRIAPLFEAAHARNQAKIVVARDANRKLAAAVFFASDQRRLWYLLSSRDPRQADNGAVSLLIWHGIKDAAKHNLTFDFDGIASAGAARFFAGFGASIRPRYVVRRRSTTFEMAVSLAAFLRGCSNRNHFTAP